MNLLMWMKLEYGKEAKLNKEKWTNLIDKSLSIFCGNPFSVVAI